MHIAVRNRSRNVPRDPRQCKSVAARFREPRQCCVTETVGLGPRNTFTDYRRVAADIREKSLGPLHPNLARSLNGLAITLAALGRTPDAFEMALHAEKIGAEDLRMSVRTLSERQALAYEGIRASSPTCPACNFRP